MSSRLDKVERPRTKDASSVQQAAGAPEDSTGTPNVNPSTNYTIKNVNSGQPADDVYQAPTADGGRVVEWPSNDGLVGQRSRHRPVDGAEPVQPGVDDPVTG